MPVYLSPSNYTETWHTTRIFIAPKVLIRIYVFFLLVIFLNNLKTISCNLFSRYLFMPTYRTRTRLYYAIFGKGAPRGTDG
jgi:hypothetical protein